MSIGNRIINLLFLLLGLVLSLVMLSITLGWLVPISFLADLFQQRDARLGIAAVSILVAILAIYSIGLNFKKKPENKFTLIDTTDFGEIHITIEAIENFIARAVTATKEVKEVKPRIKIVPEGIALLLKITINPDTNVPNVTREIQEKVAQYLKEYAGMEVLEIEVVVDKIVQPIRTRVD